MAMASRANPDIRQLNEAMRSDQRKQWLEAMKKEIDAHVETGNWKVVLRRDIPRNKRALPAIWASRRKRRLDTGEIYKWKARINAPGGLN